MGLEIKASDHEENIRSGDVRLLTVVGDTAEIKVDGILTNSPDFFARIFDGGNTTYPDIIAALASADANEDVKQAILAIDSSPGGTIEGLFEAMAAIQAFKKPLKAVVKNLAASATYGLISQADSIEAANPMTLFGSIGLVVQLFVSEHEVTITSRNAPNKRPDAKTKEGIEAIKDEIDPVALVFDEAIAEGRNTTVEKINSNFGKGATLVAKDAKTRGMIDIVQKVSLKSVSNIKPVNSSSKNIKAINMDLTEFQTTHPQVYAQVLALGITQGKTEELDRIQAHLIMGGQSGDMKTALQAIKDGDGMTATIQATYMMAAQNKAALGALVADDKKTGEAADNAQGSTEDKDKGDLSDQSQAALLAKLGAKPVAA